MHSFINASNRLPITVGKQIKKSPGGLVSALDGVGERYPFSWVGWLGSLINDPRRQEQLRRDLKEQYRYAPVFLDRREVNDYYNGFSNSSLWPLLHYMANYSRHDHAWFAAYEQVNRKFAQAIADALGDEQYVWIHDYHLMLAPKMLRELRPDCTIGFFLHTPFPSYEMFRCHPQRERLLEGMLGADLLGFHTYGYLRHFRSSVLRILDIESDINNIAYDNHTARIGVYPIGIDAEGFTNGLASAACRRHQKELMSAYNGRKIILSVDRLDYTKGIPRRLDAIERYLSKKKAVNDVVFIFVCVPTRGEVNAYQALLDEVQLRISRINGEYATLTNTPIHFLHKSVPFPQLCALYKIADVALVTPLADGMNLVSKEYIACREEAHGVLILSEFAGAAHELFNALIVNPYNIDEVADAIERALQMPDSKLREPIAAMRERVLRFDARYWAESFLGDLSRHHDQTENALPTRYSAVEEIGPIFKNKNVALFLDYDGTLCEIKKKPQDAYPHDDIAALFKQLAQTRGVDVFLISGRKREDMEHWFAAYPFTLIAEHGYYYKPALSENWDIFDARADLTWKAQIIDVFQHFAATTPGASIEEKTSSVVWHYRQADPEFGVWKAQQLVGELYEVLSNLPVEIHHGKKIVEVSSTQINKGMAMEHFVRLKPYDVVLCAGDDETDESMFRMGRDDVISIKIGETRTTAQYSLPNPAAFRRWLRRLLQNAE